MSPPYPPDPSADPVADGVDGRAGEVTLGESGVDVDVDAVEEWWASGAQWLTAPGTTVPTRLVRSIAGLVGRLDAGTGAITAGRGTGPGGVLRVVTERAALLGLGPSDRRSAGGATRILRAADAEIALTLARPDDLAAVPALLDVAPVSESGAWEVVEREIGARRATDIVERAVLLGVPAAILGETSIGGAGRRGDALARTAERVEGGRTEPAVRVEVVPGVVATRLGDADPVRPGDVVTASLASLWAGPLAVDSLARLGARVITVESLERPDGSRRTEAFFRWLHDRTEFVALPFSSADGADRLGRLLSAVDVVVEGSRPRALRQLGVEAEELVASGGPRVWVSITAHGRSGSAADRVGFGDDTAAAGGLVGVAGGDAGGRTVFLADAIADPLAGLAAAAAIVELLGWGGRWIVDVALARVAAAATDEPDTRPMPDRRRPPRPAGPAVTGSRELALGRDTASVMSSGPFLPGG